MIRAVMVAMLVAGEAIADPERPALQQNRAAEDWSSLADPMLRAEPLDTLKYIHLWGDDPKTYLSLGLTLRERIEMYSAIGLGANGGGGDVYELQRLQIHGDLHLDMHWNVFVQLEDVRAFAKDALGGADQNPLDLRQGFVGYNDGAFRARLGRQELSLDLQRFVSLRDGPNVQQAFDGVWVAWISSPWKLLALVSLPVQYRRDGAFDDTDTWGNRFSLMRIERKLGASSVSGYYALYERADAKYLDGSGDERRHVGDLRYAGAAGSAEWDVEAMGQFGHVGDKRVRAWATGARVYEWLGRTRLGLQLDAASGDHHPGDRTIETFNPMFPNGYYFSYASNPGYSNLIHVKPSIGRKLGAQILAFCALGLQWRESTEDAVYLHPMSPLDGTQARPERWTGAYIQLRADVRLSTQLSLDIEAVHYQSGDAIRAVGGTNSDYFEVEGKLTW